MKAVLVFCCVKTWLSIHGAPIARLVALNANAQPVPEQRERVSAVMRHLRAFGAGAELGCTVQQAIQQGRD